MLSAQPYASLTFKDEICKSISFIIDNAEGNLDILYGEIIQFLNPYFKQLSKERKQNEIAGGISILFGCKTVSSGHVTMLCQLIDLFPAKIIKVIVCHIQGLIKAGNIELKKVVILYYKQLMRQPEYNRDVVECVEKHMAWVTGDK